VHRARMTIGTAMCRRRSHARPALRRLFLPLLFRRNGKQFSNDITALRHSFSCPQVGLLLHFSRSGCLKSAGGRFKAPKKKLSDLGHSLASFGNTNENSHLSRGGTDRGGFVSASEFKPCATNSHDAISRSSASAGVIWLRLVFFNLSTNRADSTANISEPL
jgi:hypothetical protein